MIANVETNSVSMMENELHCHEEAEDCAMDYDDDALQPRDVEGRDSTLDITQSEAIYRIEDVVAHILETIDDTSLPCLECTNFVKRFNLSQSRSIASILMVLSFCHSLLREGRSTTTREIYYFFVTHFKNQRECELAIWDAARLCCCSRINLGLSASPKGWFCGSLKISRNGQTSDASTLTSYQGLPITREWLDTTQTCDIQSDARCILVVEKEGIYNRLSEDRFFDKLPCVLVTGKGFPDIATRALVWRLWKRFDLPVLGLCDCNSFGVGVLQTYHTGSARIGADGGQRYQVPIRWIGLLPSQVKQLRENEQLPVDVYQQLTSNDKKKIASLRRDFQRLDTSNNISIKELETMRQSSYKVELEALQWMGMDYLSAWVQQIVEGHLLVRSK